MPERKPLSMPCPKCGGRALVNKVLPSNGSIKRTRTCEKCGYRFNTLEYVVRVKQAEGMS